MNYWNNRDRDVDRTGFTIGDSGFNTTMSKDEKYMTMSVKVMDYFSYAIVKSEDNNITGSGDFCFNECGQEQWSSQCCAEISMYDERSDSVNYIQTCMDRVVADQNIGVWIDDFYATLECSRDNKFGTKLRSGAQQLTVAFAAVSSFMVYASAI